MAYIYVPLLFSFLAYGVTYLMASDVIDLAVNLVSIISDFWAFVDSTYSITYQKAELEE